MEKAALKDLMFGAVVELARNKRYYYHSSIGESYSHWTEEGKAALLSYMETMSYKIHAAEEKELDKRAKDLVMKTLKGDVK